MPGVDGYEVARRLLMKNHGVRVVAVSGWATEDDKRAALAAGFNGHLLKPVGISDEQWALLADLVCERRLGQSLGGTDQTTR
jgi:two-component system, chemotaxis family, CheB/CheR fusion protein